MTPTRHPGIERKLHPRPRYYGRTVRSVSLDGINVTEKIHPAGDTLGRHEHGLPYATLVVEGSYEEIRGGSRDECDGGTAIFHPAGERHSNRFGANETRLLNVTWTSPGNHGHIQRPGTSASLAARRIAVEMMREVSLPDCTTPIAVEALAAELVVLSARKPPARTGIPGWLLSIEERLYAEYLGAPSLKKLAAGAGVHRSHLARGFREWHGVSIGTFTRKLRVAWAHERLRRGAPIAEVAVAAGFADQSHMTRWFRRLAGVTSMRSRMTT